MPSTTWNSGATIVARKRHHFQVIDGGNPDLDWRYHEEVKAEIRAVRQIDPGLIGDLRAKMTRIAKRSARAGEIEIPMQTHPEIGEVKLFIDGRRYRLFVATPPSHLGVIVALRLWRKSGRDDEINDLQDEQIVLASDRLAEWLDSHQQ